MAGIKASARNRFEKLPKRESVQPLRCSYKVAWRAGTRTLGILRMRFLEEQILVAGEVNSPLCGS